MHVVATAGHVDHGKSTLVRALTGMEPDRWAEERRRGMTLDLGYAWTSLPGGGEVALVDVPGHERFVGTMLAGVGAVPAALVCVAADEGWMPQTQEHVDALHALQVRHALLVVTRSDLADPAPVVADATSRLSRTTMSGAPALAVAAAHGDGVGRLLTAVEDLVRRLPEPDPAAPVRLWVDRVFTVRGSGTVVTGTLPAGTVASGDELEVAPGGARVRVRGLQTLGRSADRARGVARVAANLRGVEVQDLRRGDALVTAGAWWPTTLLDVRLDVAAPPDPAPGGPGTGDPDVPAHAVLHIGSAAVPVRVRPLGGPVLRLALAHPLPLHVGDRVLLRDPGRHLVLGGCDVLDVDPPGLERRGAARARAARLLAPADGDRAEEALSRRKVARRSDLLAMGLVPPSVPGAGEWLLDPAHRESLRSALPGVLTAYQQEHPLERGCPLDVVRRVLELPDRTLVASVVPPPYDVRDGRVVDTRERPALPPPVARAVDALRRDFGERPFAAPEAGRLAELGLGPREVAAAVRVGALLRVADGVVLLPGAAEEAAALLAGLAQPFTLSEARQALGTTRRVAVPLLELLDSRRLTRRLPDDRRVVLASGTGTARS